MNQDDPPAEVKLPVGVAALACCVGFALVYWTARPVTALVHAWWAKLLVYSLPPLAVTFVILYRSNWHREMARAARTSCLAF